MDMAAKRCRLEIAHDILSAVQQEKNPRKTRIMTKSFLDWRNFERYFSILLTEELIAKSNTIEESYIITDKGNILLKDLKRFIEMKHMNSNLKSIDGLLGRVRERK